jgi:hypothetical protein
MIEIEVSFLVEKPIHHAFQRISDITNYWQWVPEKSKFFIENKVTSEGAFGLGTTYVDKLKWWGKAVGEVVIYEPPSRIKFEQKTSFGLPVFRASVEYVLKSVQNFTEVVHRFEATPCGPCKLLEPILSKIVRSERDRTCRAIKQGLEQKKQIYK